MNGAAVARSKALIATKLRVDDVDGVLETNVCTLVLLLR